MEPKTSEWRPGPTVCRCCLTEGCYKDISTEYFWMGKREVYSEMLSETFSVSISYSKSGGPNSQSRLICEQCISRLRDAADFKRQVVECEKMFMQHLDPGTSSVVEFSVPQVESSEKVKLERVKVEKVASDDDFDDGGFPDDDDDDDLDDQPLMKLASKIPKKESLDLRDLLDNTKLVLKRKAPPTSKTKPVVPTKKLKSKKEVKPAPSKAKAVAKPAPKPVEKKKKVERPFAVSRRNAELMIRHTTAYPFRLPSNYLMCVYCCETVQKPIEYKRHMAEEHTTFETRMAFVHCMSDNLVKTDCTDLRCRICDEPSDSVNAIAQHLVDAHKLDLNLTRDLGIQPFKFEEDKLLCGICNGNFPCLRQLSRHVSSHFKNHTCDNCGKSFTTKNSLQQHIRFTHFDNERICRKCMKTFATLEDRKDHLASTPKCWPYQCNHCGDRFMTWKDRITHLENIHKQQQKSHTCPECGEVFPRRTAYVNHFICMHSDVSHVCSWCGRKFSSRRSLEQHVVVHTGVKLYKCDVCSKSFPRKSNLAQHMWIHSEIKRFECTTCEKKFNQRVSYKSHMRTHHPEIEDY